MTNMVTEVYDAFVSAGADQDKARSAAVALSSDNDQIAKLGAAIDLRFAGADAAMERRFAAVDLRIERLEGRLNLLQPQVGIILGGVVALILKAFL